MTSPMEHERWRALQDIVDGALDRPANAQVEYLLAACGNDAHLFSAAARLLRACERADRRGGLLSSSAITLAAPLVQASAAEDAARAEQRSAAALEAVRTALSGTYEIEREIARGGMAVVYLARDRRHDRDVAIKVIEIDVDSAAVERFVREIRTTARLNHPHILTIHDSGEAGGFLYYVMPFVTGETLRARMRRAGPMPTGDSVRLMREIADAIAYAHAEGIVHCDLKPENVLLSGGHAVVADFGIARALTAASNPFPSEWSDESAAARDIPPSAAIALGTPAYMAPEQIAGRTDHRSDLFALGMVVYEMLAGTRAVGALSSNEGAPAWQARVSLQSLRDDVPVWLDELVRRLLAYDPEARPRDAAAVISAIEHWAESVGTTASREQRTRWRMWAAAALIMLAALGVWAGSRVLADVGRSPDAPLSVAVLPFATNEDPADFAAGLSDQVTYTLARLPDLRLAGQTSTRALYARGRDAPAVGRALGVNVVLTGAVTYRQGEVHVHATVIRSSDGAIVWDNTYRAAAADQFVLQDRITGDVAVALLPRRQHAAPSSSGAGRGTVNAEAWDVFVTGRYLFLERGAENVEQSIEHFRRAITLDPTFARAHAALAIAYGVLPSYVRGAADSTMSLVSASARRAVALDSTIADAYIALAIASENALDFDAAVRHYHRALALEPSSVMAYHALGMLLRTMGRTVEAIEVLQRAQRLDPLAKSVATALSAALASARRFDEAAAAAQHALAIDSTFSLGLLSLGIVHASSGDADSAVAIFARAAALHPHQSLLRMHLLFAYAAGGRWHEADRLRSGMRSDGKTSEAEDAFARLIFGDPQPLVDYLATPQGQRSWLNETIGFGCYHLLDPLWAHARFRDAMRRLGVLPCELAEPWAFTTPELRRRRR